MKKIIKLILALTLGLSVRTAASAAVPSDGMELWVDASAQNGVETATQGSSVKLNKWIDLSGNDRHLIPDANTYRPTYYPDATKSELKDNKAAVHFARSQYLTASNVDYSGDASFVIYYRQLNYDDGSYLFSSHSYATPEEGKVPFSIMVNANKGLSFKMGENLYDMNVSFDATPETGDDEYDGYMALYLTIDAETKTANVYNSRATEQTDLTVPKATFTLSELPYWQGYSYGLNYTQRNKGVIADIAESMIYSRELTLNELNDINKHLKIKYEYPVLSRLALEEEIYEIKKGTSVTPKIIGVGVLMGTENRINISNATIKSENSDVIIVLEGKTLKALNFGSSKITLSYEGLPDYTFVVNVPQTVINEPVVGTPDSNGIINVSQKIENFKEEQTLPIIFAVALYENDLLLDMKFQKATVSLEHTFNVNLTKPLDTQEYEINIMLLDGNTMVPLTDAVVK